MMQAFDPFTATFEEALAQPNAYATRSAPEANDSGALWRWDGAQRLLANRPHYEANPLAGVALCATHDLTMPGWLALAYLKRYRSATLAKVRSWDEAFGAAHKKGTNLAAVRRAQHNRVKAALAFSDMLKSAPTRPVDKSLWEDIGRAIGEGATRAEELYRQALHMGLALTADQVRKSCGVRVRPGRSPKPAGVFKKR